MSKRVYCLNNEEVENLQKHGKHVLLYLLLAIFSIIMFCLGWFYFKHDERSANVLLNIALAVGPVSFLGMIYEWFLFDEIRKGVELAFKEKIINYLEPLSKELNYHIDKLMENTYILSEIHKLGIIAAYRDRRSVFERLQDEIKNEENEIFLVGTSLRGLMDEEVGDKIFQDIFKEKFREIKNGKSKLKIKILLTHPAFAYLRQDLEKLYSRPEDFSIAQEIYEMVIQLKKLGAQPENIQFVKGTPTCFGIKLSNFMLLNPYPYQDQALGSLCLLVSNERGHDYIYKLFNRAHFIWNSPNTVKLETFNVTGLQSIFNKKINELMESPEPVHINDEDLKDEDSSDNSDKDANK